MFEYRKATLSDLEKNWNRLIAEHPGDVRWRRWKQQFIADNCRGAAATFLVMADGEPVGEGSLLLSPDCRAIRGRDCLCDGKRIANINALRIQKAFEGQGHISALMKVIGQYARELGITRLTIGVEAAETRNLAIYLHWGFDNFVMAEYEDGALVLYYGKENGCS